jgi:NADH-quinone oxidoreductase subunit L
MFDTAPGRIYVIATLLPLAAFAVLLVGGSIRAACRPYRRRGGFAGNMYWVCGGDKPLKTGAYLATGFMAVSAALAIVGFMWFLNDPSEGANKASRWAERTDWIRLGPMDTSPVQEWERQLANDPTRPAPPLALALEVGYKIDYLTAVIFAMVTVISTLIFIFSLGYMKDETEEFVADHEVDRQKSVQQAFHPPTGSHSDSHDSGTDHTDSHAHNGHHFQRRGRYGQFFLYLSLFCFSMLNLVIADNLFQVFVSWELVGLCSFFLIGFYYERPSASTAANKAFIVNRIGDAGFLVGIALAFAYCGTLNIEELIHRVRAPERDSQGKVQEFANQVVRVNAVAKTSEKGQVQYELPADKNPASGAYVALLPLAPKTPGTVPVLGHDRTEHRSFTVPERATYTTFGVIPYWLFVVMGIGIFLGCVGKSAQFPLHTWLPDAMEGPTPVSALIHAATMVAAGVYLVGRCFPLFAPDVLLFIAYTGAITLFITGTIALVQTDIKRILAYSTCSQLGFMMLALGVGGWVAGLLHLITHAFFKALLFLCSGSVIFGCHHEQDVRKMGGLWRKMPVTAFTMLVGVLAISGAPFLSGWYSKDQIIGAAMGFGLDHKQHIMLLVLPLITTAMTAYYMFRLWFLTFTGKPRDEKVHQHAHESPAVMTVPLIVLALFSIGVAWGWPFWDADASYLGHVLAKSEPAAVEVGFTHERHLTHENHVVAGLLALALAALGAAAAWWFFFQKQPTTESLYATGKPWYRFLLGKWYFDEAYDAAIVNPTVKLAQAAAAVDKRPTDAPPPAGEPELPPKRFDWFTLDGILNGFAQLFDVAGRSLRVVQSGRLRMYVLALALTAAVLLGILTALAR